MIPPGRISKLGEIGVEGTRMDVDVLFMRDVIIDLIRAVNELETRVERMEGRREPE